MYFHVNSLVLLLPSVTFRHAVITPLGWIVQFSIHLFCSCFRSSMKMPQPLYDVSFRLVKMSVLYPADYSRI